MKRFLPWKRILETPVLFKRNITMQRHWHLTLMESEFIFQLWLSPTLLVVLHCTSVALVLVRMGGVCLRLWNLLVPWPPSMLHAFHHQGWTWTIYVDFEEQWIPQFWTQKPFIFVLGYLSKSIYCSKICFWVRRVHALLSQKCLMHQVSRLHVCYENIA